MDHNMGFYKKRGYHVFAQLENQPPGHICYYMKRRTLASCQERYDWL
jgi:hypothetical protein